MNSYVSEPDASAAPRTPPLHRSGSELSPRFLRFFLRGAIESGRPVDSPSSWAARLHYWTVNPLGLGNYEVRHFPLSLQRRTSWHTMLFWQQLLDDYRPEPWAPAILHYEIELRETASV
jgi:hypothetical protein